jgi:hypothetical protein
LLLHCSTVKTLLLQYRQNIAAAVPSKSTATYFLQDRQPLLTQVIDDDSSLVSDLIHVGPAAASGVSMENL